MANLLPILLLGGAAVVVMGKKKKKKKKSGAIAYDDLVLPVPGVSTAGPAGASAGVSKWKARQESLAYLTRLGVCSCNPGEVDGKYGSNTKTAIRAFQSYAGIDVDGKWGPQTETAMKQAINEAKGSALPSPTPGPRPAPQPTPAPTPSGKPAGMKVNEWESANMLIKVAWEYNYDIGYMTREVYMGTHPNLNLPYQGGAGIEGQIWDRIWNYIKSQSGRFPAPPKNVPITKIKSFQQLNSWIANPEPGIILVYLSNPHAGIVKEGGSVVVATDQVDYSFKMLPLFASSALENASKRGLRYAAVDLADAGGVPGISVLSNTIDVSRASNTDLLKHIPYVAGFFGGKWRLSKWISYKKDSLYQTNTLRRAIRSVGEKMINL